MGKEAAKHGGRRREAAWPAAWLLEKEEGRGDMSNRLSGPGLARLCEDGRVFFPVPRCGARGGAIRQGVAAACLRQKGSDTELSTGDLAFPLPSDSWEGKTPCLPSCSGTVLLGADRGLEQRQAPAWRSREQGSLRFPSAQRALCHVDSDVLPGQGRHGHA